MQELPLLSSYRTVLRMYVPFSWPVSYTHLDVYKRQAMNVPSPESLMIWPSAPPPPVTNMMIPADAIPFSISARASCLSRLLTSVRIATIRYVSPHSPRLKSPDCLPPRPESPDIQCVPLEEKATCCKNIPQSYFHSILSDKEL